jgi:KamA family protein
MEKWMEELQNNITTVDELGQLLSLNAEEMKSMKELVQYYPMSVSRYYFSLIDKDDPDDPIRKMAIPEACEFDSEGLLDTSGEADNTVLTGMQHKYQETALILSSNQCAMYCRHCFRRRLVGLPGAEVAKHIDEMVAYIQDHPEINNVLISGGDALLNTNARLAEYLGKFSALPQLDFIRLGSRTPVTFPVRISSDTELLDILTTYSKKKTIYLVTHFNHPKELTPQAHEAIKALQQAGVVVKNQTVLMRGINDNAVLLAGLLRRITSWGIVQHYIFQCRPVMGVKNRFQVPLVDGSRIVNMANGLQNGLGKTADYTMSHVTGKIRILGTDETGNMVFQYHQAKNPANIGKIFIQSVSAAATWLD